MHNSYVIEVSDEQVGLIIREDDERLFRFHSVSSAFSALNGLRFADPLSAERHAQAHARQRQRKGSGIVRGTNHGQT